MVKTIFPKKNTTPIDFRRCIPSIVWLENIDKDGNGNEQFLNDLALVMNTSRKILDSHYIRASAASKANGVVDTIHDSVLQTPQSKRTESRILALIAKPSLGLFGAQEDEEDEEEDADFTEEEDFSEDEEDKAYEIFSDFENEEDIAIEDDFVNDQTQLEVRGPIRKLAPEQEQKKAAPKRSLVIDLVDSDEEEELPSKKQKDLKKNGKEEKSDDESDQEIILTHHKRH